MEELVSIIVPNYNGAATLQQCLQAIVNSNYSNYETIVVDDGSTDRSVEIIRKFPCHLVQLPKHYGAAKARNVGAKHSRGKILIFTDADCVIGVDSLANASRALRSCKQPVILGGTYTRIPFDHGFFSRFQSVFIHHAEMRHRDHPDYIATHAMAIDRQCFLDSGGFNEHFLPILEDVEFSHRMKNLNYRLRMKESFQVQHIFNFSLFSSLKNAMIKSKYWTVYSIQNKDILQDSGTASWGLKNNVVTWFFMILLLPVISLTGNWLFALLLMSLIGFNLFANRHLFLEFFHTSGLSFSINALLYYTLVYPVAVGAGAMCGTGYYLLKYLQQR